MVTRLILSLRSTANSPDSAWSLDATVQLEQTVRANRTIGGTERGAGEIALKHLSSEKRSGPPRSRDL